MIKRFRFTVANGICLWKCDDCWVHNPFYFVANGQGYYYCPPVGSSVLEDSFLEPPKDWNK